MGSEGGKEEAESELVVHGVEVGLENTVIVCRILRVRMGWLDAVEREDGSSSPKGSSESNVERRL